MEVQVSAAADSWVHLVQPVLQAVPAEMAEPANHAAALVREVFPVVAAAVADLLVAVAPVADLQELWVAQAMIKGPVAVAPEVLHLPAE